MELPAYSTCGYYLLTRCAGGAHETHDTQEVFKNKHLEGVEETDKTVGHTQEERAR